MVRSAAHLVAAIKRTASAPASGSDEGCIVGDDVVRAVSNQLRVNAKYVNERRFSLLR